MTALYWIGIFGGIGFLLATLLLVKAFAEEAARGEPLIDEGIWYDSPKRGTLFRLDDGGT